jgi:hypothetical protein
MEAKRRLLVPLLVAALALSLGLLLAGCGGGTTTTTEAATSTTVAVTTTSGGTVTTTGPGGNAPARIVVDLTGDQVVPSVQTSATGTFTLLLEASPTGFNISYTLDVSNIADVSAAHIHLGAAGANGDVIVPLFTGPTKTGSFTGTLASGSITEADLTGPMKGKTFQDLASSVLAGQTYVNVHTNKYPNGEIRGQIVLTGATAGAATTTIPAPGGSATTATTVGTGY